VRLNPHRDLLSATWPGMCSRSDSPENGATCRLWFNLGIIAFLVNMVIFCYLAFWLPYVEVRPAAIPPASTARPRRTRPGYLQPQQADNQPSARARGVGGSPSRALRD